MVYNSKNVLESKNPDGCRVLLNRSDLAEQRNLASRVLESTMDYTTNVIRQIEVLVIFVKNN